MSARESRAGPPRQGGSSSSTPIIVGVVLGGLALLGGAALLLAGSSSSGGGVRSAPSYHQGIPSRLISPAEARRLKALGIDEFNKGNSLYRQAGAFGSPGYAQKCGQAREHLYRALDCLNKAETVLMNDVQIRETAQQCSIILSACFKVPVKAR